MCKEQILNYFNLNNVTLLDEQARQLEALYKMSKKWGQIINITANLAEDAFIRENLLDAWLGYQTIQTSVKNPKSIVDAACGGGFVGFAIIIAQQDKGVPVYFVDSDRKKINFCKQVIRKLGFSHASAFCARITDFNDVVADLVTVRATWSLAQSIENTKHLIGPKGTLALFAGADSAESDFSPNDRCLQSIHDYRIIPWGYQRKIILHKGFM